MTISVANTSNGSTFQFWLDRTNDLADAMSNKVITVNSDTTTGNAVVNGIFTSTTLTANTLRGGNTSTATVLTLSSNLLITGTRLAVGDSTDNLYITSSTITIGNSSSNTVANSTIISIGNSTVNTIANSIQVSTTNISVGNSTQNTTVNSTGLSINNIPIVLSLTLNVQTTSTATQLVDSFTISTHRAAEYFVTIKDNNANAHQANKLMVLHEGADGNSLINDFGVLITNTQLGTFSSNSNTTHCRVYVTPTVSNTQIKGIRNIIVI